MSFSLLPLFHRLRWLHTPSLLLVLLLQRMPMLRLVVGASAGFGLRPLTGDLLKSAFALAALGACDSVAGATTFHATPVPPTEASPTGAGVGKTFTVSSPAGDPFGVSFTVTGAPGAAHSWKVLGTLPPGLAVTDGAAVSGGIIVNGLKLSLAGVPEATGSYSLTLSAREFANGGGRSASVTCNIEITEPPPPAAPAFTTQPLSQTVVADGSVTFTATLTGSPVPTLQWFKGDAPLEGQTSAALTLAKVQPADAGDYRVVATNASAPDGVPSEPATLTVQVPPSVTAAPAASLSTAIDEFVTLSVTATGTPAPVYQWRKDNTALPGQTGPDLALGPIAFADAGIYTVTITNAAGSRSVATRLSVAIPPPADLTDPGTLKTGSAVSFDLSGGQPVPAGLSYKATGLPAGLSLDPATGRITGVIRAKPGRATVLTSTQVGALKGPARTATLVIGAFPAELAGRYEALLETAGPDPLPGGKLAITVTTAGTFSGTLLLDDPAGHALKGPLALGEDGRSASATLTVSRPAPLPPCRLAFTVHADAAPGLEATLGLVSGDAPLAVADDGARLLAAAPAGAAGPCTLLLTDPTNLGAVAESPLGFGHATASLGAKGALSLAGRLADGTKLTASLPLGADHVARLYLKPYKLAGGYLAGPLPFTPRADLPGRWHVAADDGSALFWRKPAPPAVTTNYAEGFGPLALTARLEPWTKPAVATPLPPLLGLDADGDLALGLAASGVTNGGADPYALPTTLHFDAMKNRFAAVGTDPSAFTAKLVPATGALSGSFILSAIPPAALRKVTFTGVALQPAPADLPGLFAGGFFLLPAPVKGGPVLSGRVEFFKVPGGE